MGHGRGSPIAEGRLALHQLPLEVLYSFFGRGSGGEDLTDAGLLELGYVLFGDGATAEDQDVVCLVLLQEIDDLRDQRHVGAGEDRDPYRVGILLDGRFDYLLGGLVESEIGRASCRERV